MAYKRASQKAFSKKNIKGGFKGSEIYPCDVEAAVTKWKEKEPVKPRKSQPTTPTNPVLGGEELWQTPQSSRDIANQFKEVEKGICGINRMLRRIQEKAGKAIDDRNTRIVFLEQENAVLNARVASLRPNGRKTVQINPNYTFANIDEIIAARDEAEKRALKPAKRRARKKAAKKRKSSPMKESIEAKGLQKKSSS